MSQVKSFYYDPSAFSAVVSGEDERQVVGREQSLALVVADSQLARDNMTAALR